MLGSDGSGGAPGRSQHFHKVFTYHHIARLSATAPHWVIIPSFDHTAHLPEQRLVPGPSLLELYERRSLCPATLVVGLTTRAPLPLPACFFRPLELLLELLDAGLAYTPLGPPALDSRTPPPDWCMPMQLLVAAAQSAPAPATTGDVLAAAVLLVAAGEEAEP